MSAPWQWERLPLMSRAPYNPPPPRDLSEVQADMRDQLRECQDLARKLERYDVKRLRELWAKHRPDEAWPGVTKAPGKIAVTMLARGGR